MFRTILKLGVAAAILSLATIAFAQQSAAPATQSAVPYVNQQATPPAPDRRTIASGARYAISRCGTFRPDAAGRCRSTGGREARDAAGAA